MRVKDLIAQLKDIDEDAEVWFMSCCYPDTKWFELIVDNDGVELTGYRGFYVAGDPETSPFR